jgi:hypothetical protein
VAGDAVVYFAALRDGGYCAELVTRGRGRGAVCSTAEQTDSTPLSVTVPFTDPVTDASPVAVSGHVSAGDAAGVEFVYPDGGHDTAAVSPDRFYVFEVPTEHLRAVHRGGLMLVARDAEGRAVAEAVVPTDAVTPPTEAERPHDPIEAETTSTEDDLTQVLAVHGTVDLAGVASLKLRYPDGTAVGLELRGRRFSYRLPAPRRGDLARAPATVEAYDADGRKLGERAVASVSFWRGREH